MIIGWRAAELAIRRVPVLLHQEEVIAVLSKAAINPPAKDNGVISSAAPHAGSERITVPRVVIAGSADQIVVARAADQTVAAASTK